MGEVDIAVRLRGFCTNAAPDKIWARADHRVAPTHDVDAIGKVVNIRMHSREIAEANVGLGGFLLEGFNLFANTPDYDPDDREFNRRLAQKIEVASLRIMTVRPSA